MSTYKVQLHRQTYEHATVEVEADSESLALDAVCGATEDYDLDWQLSGASTLDPTILEKLEE